MRRRATAFNPRLRVALRGSLPSALRADLCRVKALAAYCLALLLGLADAQPLLAQTFTWTGLGSNNSWLTVENWQDDQRPAFTNSQIVMAGTTRLNPDFTAITFGSLTFDDQAGPFVISAQGLPMVAGIVGPAQITNNSAQTQTIEAFLNYQNDLTITAASGALVFTGASILDATPNPFTITVDGAYDTTIGSAMGGFALSTLVKTGSGTLYLTDQQKILGALQVNQGAVILNMSTVSDVLTTTVGPGALLGGTAIINGSLINSGTVAPGSPLDILAFGQDYTQTTGGTLSIGLTAGGTTPGTNNAVLAASRVDLQGGAVNVKAAQGTYSDGATYQFLRSDQPINGQFTSITDNIPGMAATLGYEAVDGYYWATFTLSSLPPADYVAYANTPNETALANYVDTIAFTWNDDLQSVLNGLDTLLGDPAAVRAAFNAMTDQVSPSLATASLQGTTLVVQQLAGQLRAGTLPGGTGGYAASSPPGNTTPIVLAGYGQSGGTAQSVLVSRAVHSEWRGWGFGYGLGGSAQSDGNAAGLNYALGGTLLGAETSYDDAGRLGFFGGYQGTSLQLNGLTQSARANGGMLGAYLHKDDGFNYYSLIAGLQFNGYSERRLIDFDGIHRQASGAFSGWQSYGYFERGVAFRTARCTLQPYGALQYIYLRQNNYTESGAGVLDLAVSGIDANSLRGLVGSRLQYDRPLDNGRLLPELRALWLHEFLDPTSVVNAYFGPIGGGSFAVSGLNLGRDWAILGAGLRYELAGGWNLYGNYDAQLNTQQVFHVGSGGAYYQW